MDLFTFSYSFLSPQVNQNSIIHTKGWMPELPHNLPNDVGLLIIENEKNFRKMLKLNAYIAGATSEINVWH